MHFFSRGSPVVILLLLVSHIEALGQTPRRNDATLAARIQAYLAPLEAHELSGTLLVARGKRVIIEKSFGYANHELGVRFTPLTPTNVASLTKPLTAIILAKMAEEKLVSGRDTVSRWLPEYSHGGRMTVEQLANHRAGVAHRIIPETDQEEPRTASEMVALASNSPLLFQPGERSQYSSGGYTILTAVLERAGKLTYDELLQKYVAGPVRATTIRHVDSRTILKGRATSAIPIGGTVLNAPLRDLSFLVGAGSVYTTPRDIFRVMQGVINDVYGPVARASVMRENGIHWNGITNGFRAFADWSPTDSLTVLYFGNVFTGAIDMLRRDIPRIAAGETIRAPAPPRFIPVQLSAEARARIEGQYDTGGGAVAKVSMITPGIALFGTRALVAVNDSTFASSSDYERVTFFSDSTGAIAGVQWGPAPGGAAPPGPRFMRVRTP